MLQDLRFAVRLLAKEPWFSAIVVLVLSLGIGMNAMVFTLVNAVLIRGLPFPDAASLYMVGWEQRPGRGTSVSPAELADWRDQARSFEGLAGFSNLNVNISDDRGLPEQARGTRVTANAFSLLGQQPLLGRNFMPGDEARGATPVAILGHTIWTNRYGADPAILGRTVRLNAVPTTIVGVMPPNMRFPTNTDLWTPYVPTPEQEGRRTFRVLNVFARMKRDVDREQALTEMNGIAARLVAEYPAAHTDLKRVAIETFNERYNGDQIRVVFLSMMGAVGFVLLIACANVANLMLARAVRRTREVGVRIALGATRWRIVRQLLIESVLLGLTGGALGLLLTLVGVRLFDAAVADSGKPYWIVFTVDYLVLGYLIGICVLTGVVFGLAPALQVSRTNVNDVMKEGGRGSAGGGRTRWLSSLLVVGELALTIVLLVGAGLLIRSFLKIYTLDIGIRTENLMSMRLQLSGPKYETVEARRAFFERLEPRLASIPGAQAVAVTSSVPPFGAARRTFEIDGRPPRSPDETPRDVTVVTISPGFFDVVGVQVRQGRGFHAQDGVPGSETAIINERMAAEFFATEDPIGRRVRFVPREPTAGTPPGVWRTIVGIVPTIRHSSPEDAEPRAAIYVPYRQDPDHGVALLVRSELPPSTIMEAVRQEVRAVDQDQPVFTVQTLDQMLARATWPFRVFGSLFALFAVFGLALSAVGLYAVMAYAVTQRTQEIGVRMALGAEKRQVSWLFLKRGLVQVAVGLSIGLAAAFGLSRVMRVLLVQITPTDPLTFLSISALLAAVAITACVIPARRASAVDPLTALRTE